MKQRHGFWLLFIMGVLLVLSSVVAACAPDKSAPELQEPAAPAEPSGDSAADLPVAANEGSGAAVASVEFTDDACLDCHADAERLKELAVEPEEPEESLSSGPG